MVKTFLVALKLIMVMSVPVLSGLKMVVLIRAPSSFSTALPQKPCRFSPVILLAIYISEACSGLAADDTGEFRRNRLVRTGRMSLEMFMFVLTLE